MCPSIAVLGGGGDGGGGSGKGGGNGNGDGPGDGDGNGDGANGDGTGAGNCGQGGAGSCTNCEDGTTAGDPVDVGSGNVFTMPNLDVVLPGPVDLHWVRSYSASQRGRDVGFGVGWSFTFGWSVEVRRAEIRVVTGSGSALVFPMLRAGQSSPRTGGFILRHDADGTFRLVGQTEFTHVFEAAPERPGFHRLRSVRHANGNGFELRYRHDGQLVAVVDAAGRTIDVAGDGQGHVASLSVADPTSGRRITYARFTYDADRLVQHVDADGASTRYAYDDRALLVRLQYASGLTFHYRYDAEGRCVETWGESPDLAATLDDGLPELLADGVTRARGIFHNVFTFQRGEEGSYSEAIDSVRSVRLDTDANGRTKKGVGAGGGVTSRERDEFGRLVRHTDPAGATTLYQWDENNRLIGMIDPEGRREVYVRDDLGRPIQTIDRAGGIVDGVRDARGNLVEVTDQTGATTRSVFDQRNLMTQSISPEGAVTRFESDAHGNITARVNPDGARWTWRWDYFGRPVERTDPRGNVTRTTYSDAGNVLSVEEPSGRRVDYSYDAMGSCTAITVNGMTTRYEFGGLRWRLSETLPDGRTTRYRYNREGWCTRIVNAANEESRFDYDARGLAKTVTLFDGTVRRNRWDEMGRLIGYDDGAGWATLVRDIVGRVVSAKYADGTEESVEYDELGMPARWCGPGGDVRVARDRKGRIVRESVKLGEVTTEVLTSYDRVGRPSVVTSSLGYGVSAKRDPMGRRTALDLAGREVGFEYDPLGFETARTLPEGGRIETSWDVAPRVRGRTLRRRGAARADRPDEPQWVGQRNEEGAIHASFSFDDHDNVLSVTEPEEGLAYRYDAGHHLVARDSTTRPREEFFTDAGGRTHQKDVPQAVAEGGRIIRKGELDYTWDARGRLVRVKGPSTDRRFVWTARSELARVELGGGVEVAFTYDPLGRRTTRTLFRRVGGKLVRKEWSRFVWSGGSLLHEYRELAGKTRRCIRTTYVPDRSHRVLAEKVDKLEGDLVREGPWMFHVHDASGAPLRLAGADGSSLARMERDTLGAMRSRGAVSTQVRLLGQLADEETGLHYNRHRYYDPALGTFINRDPIGLRGGFEMYAYAPNPIGFADPLGLSHECTCRLVTRNHPNGVGPTGSSVPRNGGSRPGFTSGFGSETDVNFIPGMEGSDARRRRTQNDTQATSHTERHAAEWAEHHLDEDELEGSQMFLGGQHPPCAMCNRRMQRFAEDHGATVEYNWPVNNRLRYDGREQSNGTVDARPTAISHRGNAVGAEAEELAAANQTTPYSRQRARARGDDEGTEAHRAVYQRQMADRERRNHPANRPNSGGHVDDTWP